MTALIRFGRGVRLRARYFCCVLFGQPSIPGHRGGHGRLWVCLRRRVGRGFFVDGVGAWLCARASAHTGGFGGAAVRRRALLGLALPLLLPGLLDLLFHFFVTPEFVSDFFPRLVGSWGGAHGVVPFESEAERLRRFAGVLNLSFGAVGQARLGLESSYVSAEPRNWGSQPMQFALADAPHVGSLRSPILGSSAGLILVGALSSWLHTKGIRRRVTAYWASLSFRGLKDWVAVQAFVLLKKDGERGIRLIQSLMGACARLFTAF